MSNFVWGGDAMKLMLLEVGERFIQKSDEDIPQIVYQVCEGGVGIIGKNQQLVAPVSRDSVLRSGTEWMDVDTEIICLSFKP